MTFLEESQGPLYIGYPFLDLHGVLATTEGHQLGWDLRTIATNPLDHMGRGNSTYPNIWFYALGVLGLTRQHEIPLALAINGVFLVILIILLYPRSWPEVIIGFLAICAPGHGRRKQRPRDFHSAGIGAALLRNTMAGTKYSGMGIAFDRDCSQIFSSSGIHSLRQKHSDA